MQINELISPQRINQSLPATSKKKLLEEISGLLHQDEPDVDENAAFHSLIERERLGSTGIGHGIALPHGRLRGLQKAIGAFAVLENEMEFDAIDNKPVKMVFALLVPEHANEEHLKLLSQLAGIFDNAETRELLLHASNKDEIYQYLTSRDDG
ncbi:MAG: PTS IIA-like nitrogen regulatory protein PtsN [Gammaproteobacteria bacterium]|nr:MAG: PTS IIA-like nitrogen regulatory protein PtsN [Gammaproteobacteria bacterium]